MMEIDEKISQEIGQQAKMKFERWIPLARQVVTQSLHLGWDDVVMIYTYVPTIPLAEALALEARQAGADTHLTLMTDDLWFTSMQKLPLRWLRSPSLAEKAMNGALTATIYLGGPADGRRLRTISPKRFVANGRGGYLSNEPLRRRRVRHIDMPIGRVSPERAEAYELDYGNWKRNYEAALGVDLREISKLGRSLVSRFKRGRYIRIRSDAGTDLRFHLSKVEPFLDDGIVSSADIGRGNVEGSLPAGKAMFVVEPSSVEGEIHFELPIFLFGRVLMGLHLKLRDGRLREWSAEKNRELFESYRKPKSKERDLLSWFSIGLNPAAEACMLDNSIVKDVVSFGFGANRELGGTIGGSFRFSASAHKAAVDVSR